MLIRLMNLDGTLVETTPFGKIVMVQVNPMGKVENVEMSDAEIEAALAGQEVVRIVMP